MRFKKIVKLFKKGNVSVSGLRGTGKDVLFGNVIARRRKEAYISNLNYGGAHFPFDISKLNLGGNTWKNFLVGNVSNYVFPYPSGSDVYISDAGVYFPAQHVTELNKSYDSLVAYQALSRQVSHNNVHFNAQNLNRVWDKIREQSDIYINCEGCWVSPRLPLLGSIVFQRVTLYEKYESCVSRVRPCRIRVPLFNKVAKMNARIRIDEFNNQHGKVRPAILVYRNKSKHDTYYFERLLRRGVPNSLVDKIISSFSKEDSTVDDKKS